MFSLRFVSGGVFPAPSFFTTAKTIFQSYSSMTLLPENVKNPRKTYFNPFTLLWNGVVRLNYTKKYFEVAENLRVLVIKSISKKGGRKMLQTNLKVVAVGEPNIEALTDGEKQTFFESIFSRIVELHQQTQTENKNET